MSKLKIVFPILALLALGACAHAVQVPPAEGKALPGFLLGLWHGFILPWSFIGSLFNPDIAIYSVPNNGGWYDFGFFLGIGGLAGGTTSSR